MRSLQKYALAVIVGGLLVAVQAEAAEQRVNIRLGGKFCEFYLVDVAKALKQVPGVTKVDLEAVQGHVVVTMTAGQVNPTQLLAAIRRVKGDGYYCQGQFAGEPGKIED